DDNDMEEERRLCYVGLTRAKERLVLSAAGRRLVWGNYSYNQPSRFLDEIPQDLLYIAGQNNQTAAINASKKDYKKMAPKGLFSQPEPALKTKATSPGALVSIGDKVEHSKFGEGVVVSLTGQDASLQVNVAFPLQGIKKLMWVYAPIKKIQ
ncbi:MAG: 3'-5' exonuclease, partial [Clostridiales bacterium]